MVISEKTGSVRAVLQKQWKLLWIINSKSMQFIKKNSMFTLLAICDKVIADQKMAIEE